ncbi:hypothetical protein EC973_008510 [Apophysomyces ossiformis]|uniref:Uncharacterized protein n=1 Tax=Apophysomyces ossiformis TaxID=679940 RepID=A0A8H7EP50_9FUNG|nr:hypothetical protein EC973_008510 [Apophysomyces ossiformis]
MSVLYATILVVHYQDNKDERSQSSGCTVSLETPTSRTTGVVVPRFAKGEEEGCERCQE